MTTEIRDYVFSRANRRCEYCQLRREESFYSFHVEHIIPRQHGGSDDLDNLALACRRCNLYKGPNLAAFDPETDQMTALYHPRRERWDEHFKMEARLIVGLTPEGRATVRLLRMNDGPRRAFHA